MEKAIRVALLSAVLVLASYLRITGLDWGLTSGYGSTRNFHPDEFYSLRGVLQIDLLKGRLEAPAAYFEGTFNYYLWAIPKAALKLSGRAEPPSAASTGEEDHASLLYICRWMTLLFDLATIIIVFLAIREATQNFYASFLGACLRRSAYAGNLRAFHEDAHIKQFAVCAGHLDFFKVADASEAMAAPQRWLYFRAGSGNSLPGRNYLRHPVPISALRSCW